MEDVNYMLECRALFLYNIALMNGSPIYLNDYLNDLLLDFFRTYGSEYFDLFSLVCYFEATDDSDEYDIREEEEWQSRLYEYLKPLCLRNQNIMTKIYGDIGHENVLKISKLAELFYEYIDIIMSEKKLIRVRQ